MPSLDLGASVVDWCIEYPEAIPFFERHGIDYCCGGKSLEYACQQRALDPVRVLAELEQMLSTPRPTRSGESGGDG